MGEAGSAHPDEGGWSGVIEPGEWERRLAAARERRAAVLAHRGHSQPAQAAPSPSDPLPLPYAGLTNRTAPPRAEEAFTSPLRGGFADAPSDFRKEPALPKARAAPASAGATSEQPVAPSAPGLGLAPAAAGSPLLALAAGRAHGVPYGATSERPRAPAEGPPGPGAGLKSPDASSHFPRSAVLALSSAVGTALGKVRGRHRRPVRSGSASLRKRTTAKHQAEHQGRTAGYPLLAPFVRGPISVTAALASAAARLGRAPLIAAGFAIGLLAGLGLAALAFSERGVTPTLASPVATAGSVAEGARPDPASDPQTSAAIYEPTGAPDALPAAERAEIAVLAPVEEPPFPSLPRPAVEEARLASAPAEPSGDAEPFRATDQATGQVESGSAAALPPPLSAESADGREATQAATETSSAPGSLAEDEAAEVLTASILPPGRDTALAPEEGASRAAILAPDPAPELSTAEPDLPPAEAAYPPLEVQLHAPETVLPAEVGLMVSDLDARGFDVGDPKRVALTISSTQVRYFHPEDAAAAGALAELLFAEARDFTTYRPSPPPGRVEVWLAGRAERTERRATAPRRTAAPPPPGAGLAAAMSEIERGLDRLFGAP